MYSLLALVLLSVLAPCASKVVSQLQNTSAINCEESIRQLKENVRQLKESLVKLLNVLQGACREMSICIHGKSNDFTEKQRNHIGEMAQECLKLGVDIHLFGRFQSNFPN